MSKNKLTKEEKINQIDLDLEKVVDESRAEAKQKQTPLVFELKLETLVSNWKKRHPEYKIGGLYFESSTGEFTTFLETTGVKPLTAVEKLHALQGGENNG